MAITSIGYDGTVDERAWARLQASTASVYGVSSAAAWRVNAVPGADRTVSIAAGVGWGQHVLDESDMNYTLQGDTISSGSRWDLVVMRRDWTAVGGGPSAFRLVKGTATRGLPSRQTNPGTVDDQPIALVEFRAGQTQPGTIIDLRAWAANGGLEAADKMALDYLNRPGAAVKIGTSIHRYQLGANNVWSWVEYPLRNPGTLYTPTWSGFQYRGDTHVSRGIYWVNDDRVTVQAMIQSGARPSLGLNTVGFSLPPGLPTANHFLSSGTGIHSTSGTGGLMRPVVPLIGPNQTGCTLWVERNPMVSPGRAGYPWGEGASFHVQIEYQRA